MAVGRVVATAGRAHTQVARLAGCPAEVYVWGRGEYGRLGLGDRTGSSKLRPQKVGGLTEPLPGRLAAAAAGWLRSLCITIPAACSGCPCAHCANKQERCRKPACWLPALCVWRRAGCAGEGSGGPPGGGGLLRRHPHHGGHRRGALLHLGPWRLWQVRRPACLGLAACCSLLCWQQPGGSLWGWCTALVLPCAHPCSCPCLASLSPTWQPLCLQCRLGTGGQKDCISPVELKLPGGPERWRVISVAAGGRHSMVLALPDNGNLGQRQAEVRGRDVWGERGWVRCCHRAEACVSRVAAPSLAWLATCGLSHRTLDSPHV